MSETPNELALALRVLARLLRSYPSQQSNEPTKQDVIAKAIEILGSNEGGLTVDDITRRVSAVRDLIQIEIPFEERRELDRELMRLAMQEPEARAIIRQIFRIMAPTSGPNLPQRDEQGHIIHRDRPKLSVPTEEDIARWDTEWQVGKS